MVDDLYLPPRRTCAWISAYVGQSQDEAAVFLAFGKGLSKRSEWFDSLYEDRDAIDQVVPGLLRKKRADGMCYVGVPPIPDRRFCPTR